MADTRMQTIAGDALRFCCRHAQGEPDDVYVLVAWNQKDFCVVTNALDPVLMSAALDMAFKTVQPGEHEPLKMTAVKADDGSIVDVPVQEILESDE